MMPRNAIGAALDARKTTMTDPKVEEIRKQVEATHDGWIIGCNHIGGHCGVWVKIQPVILSLLTKLDEAERAGIRAVAAEIRKKQRAYDAQVEANIRTNRAVECERVLLDNVTEAEMREQVLLAGVRELAELMSPEATLAATGFEDDGSRLTIEDVLKVTEHTVERTAKVRAILSRLLPSTPEEGKSHE